MSPTFSDPGYTFVDWNTSADGTGTTYSDGEVYSFTADLTLYAQWTPNHVTFHENDSASDAVVASQQGTSSMALTAFALLSPQFANPGYSFSGWNTAANGSGSSYADQATYDFVNGSMDLYAQWTANQYTVTYNPNGGTVSVTSANYVTGSAPLTLPTPTQSGYVATGWFTAATGGSLVGAVGSDFAPTSSLTLYAQWSANEDVVSLDSQGGVGVPTSLTYASGAAPLILPTPTMSGYVFSGWFSAPSGGGLVGFGGSSYTPTGSATLFAQWAPGTFVIDLNAGKGVLAESSLQYTTGEPALTLPTPVLSGSSFLGWFSASSGGTLVGVGGSNLVPTTNMSLYAQWGVLPNYTITFVSNGAQTSVPALTGVNGSVATIPASATLSASGVRFAGWNTMPDGSGVTYQPGGSFTPSGEVTLYAMWQALPTVTIRFNLNGARGSMTSLHGAQGSVVTLPVSAGVSRSGYHFTGWASARSGGTRYRAGANLTLRASETLYAQWATTTGRDALVDVGPFAAGTSVLNNAAIARVSRLAGFVVTRHLKRVVLYGYASDTDVSSLASQLSLGRARAVASVLRADFRAMHVGAVKVIVRAEGPMKGRSGAPARRVDAFAS